MQSQPRPNAPGTSLRRAREDLGLSIEEASFRAGVRVATAHAIEGGTEDRLVHLEKYAQASGVDLLSLAGINRPNA
jgi:hypothetical protein